LKFASEQKFSHTNLHTSSSIAKNSLFRMTDIPKAAFPLMELDNIKFSSLQSLREHIQTKHPTLFPHFERQCGIFIALFLIYTDDQAISIPFLLSLRNTNHHRAFLILMRCPSLDTISKAVLFSSASSSLRRNRREISL